MLHCPPLSRHEQRSTASADEFLVDNRPQTDRAQTGLSDSQKGRETLLVIRQIAQLALSPCKCKVGEGE